MLIKPINTVVLAEDFEKVKEWYIDTFDFVEVSYPGMEDAYVDLLSGDQVIVGITQNDTKEPLPVPRKNAQYLQVSCSHIFTLFEKVSKNGGKVMFGPSKDEGYWYGGIKDIEGNTIWIYTPDSDLKEEIPQVINEVKE
jgi:predicted enzyme related to lactoylglutathione lyase